MKNLKNAAKYSLYILLPLLSFAAIQLIFAYSAWEINPSKWSDFARGFSAMSGIFAIVLGVLVARKINEGY